MSRFIKSILFAAALILAASCDLTRLPKDEVLASGSFGDADALAAWIAPCYSLFEGDMMMLQDADDFIDNSPCGFIFGRDCSEWEPDSKILDQINYFLDNVSLCPDEDAVEEYTAVAHFFRALYNFNCIRLHGDLDGTREDDMWDVIDEFWLASDHLGEDLSTNATYVNRWVALAYLARVALYEGTFRKYQGYEGWEDYLCEAVSACDEIYMGKKFTLARAASYGSLFNAESLPNTEAILQRLYGSKLSSDYYDILYGSKLSATRRFVSHFQLADGSSVSTRRGYESEPFTKEYLDRDPRLASIILFPGYTDPSTGLEVVNELYSLTGYQPVKFRKNDSPNFYNCYYPLFRYAEILLIEAEAKAELNGYAGNKMTQSVLDKTVNLIRTRAGMPALNLSTANANPDGLMATYYPNVPDGANRGVILEIRRERTIELALEGQRLWDMLRWHEGAQLGNRKNAYRGIYITKSGLVDLTGDGKADIEIYEDKPSQSKLKSFKIGTDIVLSEGNYGYIIAYPEAKFPETAWDEENDYTFPVLSPEI